MWKKKFEVSASLQCGCVLCRMRCCLRQCRLVTTTGKVFPTKPSNKTRPMWMTVTNGNGLKHPHKYTNNLIASIEVKILSYPLIYSDNTKPSNKTKAMWMNVANGNGLKYPHKYTNNLRASINSDSRY